MIPHDTNTNYDKIPLVLWFFVLYVVYLIKQYKYLTYIITAHFKLKENINSYYFQQSRLVLIGTDIDFSRTSLHRIRFYDAFHQVITKTVKIKKIVGNQVAKEL